MVPAQPAAKPRAKPAAERWLTIRAPTERNLRGHDVRLKLDALNVVCGVSGSGKSTLVEDVLVRQLLRARGEATDEPGACAGIEGADGLHEVVLVDQELPSGSSRANCATYLKVWDAVRARLADAPLAVQRGYTPSTFSFNKDGGRCPVCEGLGYELVEMQFLSDVRMTCEACEGRRFRADVLQVSSGARADATLGAAWTASAESVNSGTVSLSSDGFAVARRLESEAPELFELLSTLSLPGRRLGAGVDLQSTRPVFRHDHTGRLVQVSFNDYDRAPFLLDEHDMVAFYDAIRLFDEVANEPSMQWRHVLQPGEALLVDNWRVLHGRTAFTGERRVCGGYLNREDVQSRLRCLLGT